MAQALLHLIVVENHLQLILRDLAIAVPVEDSESRPANVLLDVLTPVQSGCQEFRVIDDATAVSIHVLHDLLQIWRNFLQASLLQTFLQLSRCQQAIAILVQTHEGVSQRLDLILIQLTSNDVQGSLLQLVLGSEATQIVHKVGLQCHGRGFGCLVLDPLMIQGLLSGVTIFRVHLQQVADQGFGILRNVLPICGVEVEVAQTHLGQHLRVGVTEEGWVATQQDVHDHTAAPQVAQLVVVAGQHLRGHVVRSAGFGGQKLARRELARKAEVDDLQKVLLNGVLGHEEEILRFQITMAHLILVHVVDGTNDLLHQNGRLHFREVARLDDPVKELSARAELHDQIDVPVIFKRLKELDDVWVVHHLHDGNLLLEALQILHLRLGDGLHSTDGLGGDIGCFAHRSIGSFTQLLLVQLVVVCDLARVLDDELRVANATLLDFLLWNRATSLVSRLWGFCLFACTSAHCSN
mmetsp:Transcript_98942/g.121128  ORF Transcript_98942/g.121128 Transcript_98942/m.121128 type:complete len:466 (+) Transcript_98942:305-1702(+)